MELNWSTFLLEMLNFAVLVWLLAHFLYKPLQSVIARRQQAVADRLAEAAEREQRAEAQQAQLDNRLQAWEQERQQAREQLQQELAVERSRKEQALQQQLEQARQRDEVLQQRHRQTQRNQLERQALQQGARFAGRILSRCADAGLEARLIELLIDTLPELPEEQLLEMRQQVAEQDLRPGISTAFALQPRQHESLETALQTLLQHPVSCRFDRNPDLIAGIRITLGPWVIQASLQDELASLAEFAHEQ
jgi:F-type H+-transporting ATPase subunit b